MMQQYAFGQLTLPKELIYSVSTGESVPLAREVLHSALADGGQAGKRLLEQLESARKALDAADKSDSVGQKRLKDQYEAAQRAYLAHAGSTVGLIEGQARKYQLTVPQLVELAEHYRSKPVHPAQLYETISGLIISWLLSVIFYYRRRHGIVLPWFLILYSVSRILLESIRQDNPLDVAGVTISQAISVFTFLVGIVSLIFIHRSLPMVGPRVERFVFPEDAPPAKAAKA
jgi:hypothetical protein